MMPSSSAASQELWTSTLRCKNFALITGQPRESPRNHWRACPAPITQMGLQGPLAGIQAGPAGFPSRLSLRNSDLARKPSKNGEGDDESVPIQGSNRKRTASQQPDALHKTPKSMKYKNETEESSIIITDHDEASDTPLASFSRSRHRRSPAIKVEDAFTSRPTSRPPDDGALNLDILEYGGDGQPLSRPNAESLKFADEPPYFPGPGLATNQSTPLDSSVIEEQDPLSLPSLIASSTATREQPQDAPKPEVQIQYFIITARTPRLSYTLWPEGTLRDKILGEVFDEVALYTSKKRVEEIVFKLSTSQVEMEYPIRRGDKNTFEDMRRAFNESLRVDRKKGVTKFKIWLEPDPAGHGLTEAELVEGSNSEDDTV